MAKLTIAAAARLCHVDRRTLQRAIHAGRLHLDAQHCLSTDELMRAGYLIADTPHGTPLVTPLVEPQGTPLLPLLERLTVAVEGLWQEARQLREVLLQTPQGTPQPTPQDTPLVTPQRWRHKTTKTPQVTPQVKPQGTPQSRGPYDPGAALARMQTLRREGLSFARIAEQLTAEGVPTRYGLPWQHSSVRYLLRTNGW